MLIFLCLCITSCLANQQTVLQDKSLTATFNSDITDSNFGNLNALQLSPSSSSTIVSNVSSNLFSIEIITPNTKTPTISIQSSSNLVQTRSIQIKSPTDATFKWTILLVNNKSLLVTINVFISKYGLLEYHLSFTSTDDISIWSWKLWPASTSKLSGGDIFDPTGFGVVHHLATSASATYHRLYPQATMQFMAAFATKSASTYVAAHDSRGESKTLSCDVDVAGTSVRFSISATPPHAGVSLASLPSNTLAVNYPIVVVPFGDQNKNNNYNSNDVTWFDAASIYRNTFAIELADWTKSGPLSKRKDVPLWSQNLTVWINSHWQGNDIFNISGGAPNVVEERVTNIAKRFDLEANTLGLHWYEWDTLGYTVGSNYTQCKTEITCGFDTHYPEYFPAREGFNQSLKRIQNIVRVVPYVNGRIFDQHTASWNNVAKNAAAKNVKTPGAPPLNNLILYNESYGSKAIQAVMCPHTNYWQTTMSDVVGTLTNEYQTDGVYIDQIAAAGPRSCFDPTHNHSLGGGFHWVSGYVDMLKAMRLKAGNNKLLLTESNAEPFMGNLDMFLTLVGFSAGDLSPPTKDTKDESSSYIIPAFQSVYGGYALFMGAEFFQNDLVPNPNIFSAKIANQLLFGSQIGWFSLGGRNNQNPAMGLYELLMSSEYDNEIHYLKVLSYVKRKCNQWLTHGRAMRNIILTINGTTTSIKQHNPLHPRESRKHSEHHSEYHSEHHSEHQVKTTSLGLSYNSVMSACWMSADGSSLLVVITTVDRYTPATVHAVINMKRYGFSGDETQNEKFNVFNIPSFDDSSPTLIGTYNGDKVEINANLGVHAVRLLKIEKV